MKKNLLAAGIATTLLLIALMLLLEAPSPETGPTVFINIDSGPKPVTERNDEAMTRDALVESIAETPVVEETGSQALQQSSASTNFSELPPTPARRERLEEISGGLRLSPRVIAIVTEIQARQVEEQWEEATNELNALYEEWDLLNTLEKTTLLNFYTNNFLAQQMYPEAIATFSRMLTIPDLRPDIAARALKSFGQLYLATGQPELAVPQFEEWIESSYQLDLREGERERVEEFLMQSQNMVEQQGEFEF